MWCEKWKSYQSRARWLSSIKETAIHCASISLWTKENMPGKYWTVFDAVDGGQWSCLHGNWEADLKTCLLLPRKQWKEFWLTEGNIIFFREFCLRVKLLLYFSFLTIVIRGSLILNINLWVDLFLLFVSVWLFACWLLALNLDEIRGTDKLSFKKPVVIEYDLPSNSN